MATIKSIEEKAKRYDEAIIRGSRLWESDMITRENYEYIFPELAESEDARIRKAIYNCVKWFGFDSCFFKDVSQEECLAWLEKQGEQKSAWSEEDEKQARQIERVVHDDGCTQKLQKQIADWFKSLKNRVQPQPKQEWSEEDEKHIMAIDLAVNRCDGKWNCCGEKCPISEHSPWLKSLKERYTWKPSELQIEALDSATKNCAYSEYQDCLRELIGQLKKLREE